FGPPGKHCEGQTPESDEDLSLDHSSSPNGQILKAIRTLSEQVGALKIEQEDMRSRINDKEGGGAPEQHKAKTPQGKDCPNKSTNKHAYIDLHTLLPKKSGKTNTETEPKRTETIESFDQWLEAWTIYEGQLMSSDPTRYNELARYRSIIQKANRKFRWSAVYDYDTQFRKSLDDIAPSGQLDIVDTTLYSTILDSSSVRKEGLTCQRCKSENHLVRDCLFRPKSTLEENKTTKKASSGQADNNWNFERWFANNKQGCNLYQRRACQQGAECKRAHVCKACRGNHSLADCKLSANNSSREVPRAGSTCTSFTDPGRTTE
ncbi:hypothetical protein QZH41_009484, partial [Actinostola sp. cb2023]